MENTKKRIYPPLSDERKQYDRERAYARYWALSDEQRAAKLVATIARNHRPEVMARNNVLRAKRIKRPDERLKCYARARTRYAIKTGKLTRGLCERCGQPSKHAHHDDYSKWLEVRWFCSPCHHNHHALERTSPLLAHRSAGAREE